MRCGHATGSGTGVSAVAMGRRWYTPADKAAIGITLIGVGIGAAVQAWPLLAAVGVGLGLLAIGVIEMLEDSGRLGGSR